MRLSLLSEGRFPVTEHMKKVAKLLARKSVEIYKTIDGETSWDDTVMRWTSSGLLDELHGEEIEVDGGKYGKKDIYFSLALPSVNHKTNSAFADITAGIVAVFVTSGNYEHYYDSLIHEMIHMFDPKLNHPKLRDKSAELIRRSNKDLDSRTNDSNDEKIRKFGEYISLPHELDAHIATISTRLVTWVSGHKQSVQGVKALLRMLSPGLALHMPKDISVSWHLLSRKGINKRFLKAVQGALDDLVESGRLVDDESLKRTKKVTFETYKSPSSGKYHYKMDGMDLLNHGAYHSEYYDTVEEMRENAKLMADALANW